LFNPGNKHTLQYITRLGVLEAVTFWRWTLPGMWPCGVWWVLADVSKKPTIVEFKVERWFYAENGGSGSVCRVVKQPSYHTITSKETVVSTTYVFPSTMLQFIKEKLIYKKKKNFFW